MSTFSDHPMGYSPQQTDRLFSSAFVNKISRALRLDIALYEEVEEDRSASSQAVLVIVLSSIAAGIGSLNVSSLIVAAINTVSALVGWFLWAYLTYIIGTKLLPEPQTYATYGQMIRTTGFASSPGLFRIFGLIPYIGPFVFLVAQVWMLLAMIIAVKQALDYKNGIRSVGVALIGWIVQVVFLVFIVYLVKLSAM